MAYLKASPGSTGQRPKGHPLKVKPQPLRIPNRPQIELERLIDYRTTCVAAANHYADELTDEQRYLVRRELIWTVWQFRTVSQDVCRAWRGRMFSGGASEEPRPAAAPAARRCSHPPR